MDRETMRRMLLAGIDRILGRMFGVSAVERAMAQAQRTVYSTDDDAVDKVLAHYVAPSREEMSGDAEQGEEP